MYKQQDEDDVYTQNNKINATRKFKLSILGYTVVNLLCEGRDIPHDFKQSQK